MVFVVKQLIVTFRLTPRLSLIAFYWFEPATLPSPDSYLFTPTPSRDLIEGNHSDKKPPTIMPQCCVCVCMCEEWWVLSNSTPNQARHLLSSVTLHHH